VGLSTIGANVPSDQNDRLVRIGRYVVNAQHVHFVRLVLDVRFALFRRLPTAIVTDCKRLQLANVAHVTPSRPVCPIVSVLSLRISDAKVRLVPYVRFG